MKVSTSPFGLGPRSFAISGFLIAVVIGLAGFLLASMTKDPDWAGRFGSLIVVYALALLVVMKLRSGELKSNDLIWKETTERAIGVMSEGSSGQLANVMTNELNGYGQYVRAKWFFVFEVVTIALGTLLWGFGDLVALHFFGIGSVRC